MKHIINKHILIKVVLILLTVLVLLVLIYNRKMIMELLNPFLISLFIAYLLNPMVTKVENMGIKRNVGIILIFLIFLCSVAFLCFYMVPALVRDIGKLVGSLPAYTMKLRDMVKYCQDGIRGIGLPSGITSSIDSNINRLQIYAVSFFESFTNLIIKLLSKMFSIVLIPILVYYFLRDFKNVSEKTLLIIPRKYRSHAERIWSSIDCVFGNYVRSQLILSLIISVMTTAALMLLKIDFALIIGIINGITNIIPYFGPVIGAIPAVVIALLESPAKAVYTIIAITIIQQIESDLICPKITADSVGLHPLTVIFALFAGGELFGAAGLILGVPVAAAIKVIYRDVMKNMF